MAALRPCRIGLQLDIAGEQVHALLDTGTAKTLMADKTYLNMCLKLGRPSLLRPTGTVCGLSGTTLPVIGETEIRIENTGTFSVLVTKDFPHEILLGSDALTQGQGKIGYAERRMTWFRRDFKIIPYTDSLPHTASIYDSCGHPGIDEVMRQYTDVFDEDLSNLGHCDIIPLTVNVDGHRPIRQIAYRTPLPKRNVADEQVDEMLKAGVIQTSTSPWAAPVTLTPKKDGSYRFCIDYRKLNAVTVKDCYPLPLIQDIFDQLGGTKLFSTLDLKSGHWQIPVDPKDRQKTAFTCHRGLFEFNRMPFGLAIFQKTMDKVLHGLIGVCCFVYIDDIIIYSRNAAEHAHHLKLVMDRLRAAGLKVKPGNCKIAQTEVKLLGYIVSTDGISSDPEKTRAIATMSAPT